MATYYVKPTGNNSSSDPTNSATPWKTLAHAVPQLEPGDTLRLMTGTWNERLEIAVSGTNGNPITIEADSGATPVIDGGWRLDTWPDYENDVVKGEYGNLVSVGMLRTRNGTTTLVGGSYIVLDGLTIRGSSARNVAIFGRNVTMQNCTSYEAFHTGCIVWPASGYTSNHRADVVVDNCEIYYCSQRYWSRFQRKYTTDGTYIENWPPPLYAKGATHVTFSNNVVHDNGGEGIGYHGGSNITVEDNISYNNAIYQIYADWAGDDSICRRNICYVADGFTGNSSSKKPGGIGFHDEVFGGHRTSKSTFGGKPKPTRRFICTNNVVVGCWYGFAFFGKSNLIDCKLHHNTIVNCDVGLNIYTLVKQPKADQTREWSGTTVRNNIFDCSENSVPSTISGITFDRNNYRNRPAKGSIRGPNDIYGDPKLAARNASYTGGNLDTTDYHLTSTSPGIGRGLVGLEAEDYRGAARDNAPDIGFHEYSGEVTPTLSPGFTLSASEVEPGTTVNITSTASMSVGTIDSWAYHYSLDGAGWTSIGTSEDETFAPTADGEYRIRQTVTDTETAATKYYTLTLIVTSYDEDDNTGGTVPTAGNLITNGTFDSSTTGWSKSGTGSWTVDSGRLKLTNTSALYVYQAVGAVTSGDEYAISFDSELIGGEGYEVDRVLEISLIQDGSPYADLIDRQYFTIPDLGGENNYSQIVTINTTDANARLRFKFPYISGFQTFHLDNVTFGPNIEVTASFTLSDSTPAIGDTVTITDTSTGATSWQWYWKRSHEPDDDFELFSQAQNPSWVAPDDGEFVIKLIAAQGNVEDSTEATVTTSDRRDFYRRGVGIGVGKGLP